MVSGEAPQKPTLEDFARLSRYTSFLYFSAMSKVLGADTERYAKTCAELMAHNDDALTPQAYAELGFWVRGRARAFLIFVEGLLFVMRRLILYAEERREIELSRGESHLIRETDYVLHGEQIDERPRFIQLKDSLRLTLRLFPQVFGSNFQPDYSGDGWVKFQRLVALRNALTHPKLATDTLLNAELPNTIRDAALWFYDCVRGILGSLNNAMMEESQQKTAAMPEVAAFRREFGV